MKEIAA